MSAASIVKPITTCRLCKQKFTGSPLNIPIIGEPVTASAERFVSALAGHLMSRHREEGAAIILASKQLYGFLSMLHFDTEDEGLKQLAELIRWDIHRSTRKIAISDDHISKAVKTLDLSSEQTVRTEALIRDLRDLLTDSGRYAPQKPTEQPSLVSA